MPSGYPHTHPAILHCLLPWLVHVLCYFGGICVFICPTAPPAPSPLYQKLLRCILRQRSALIRSKKSKRKEKHSNSATGTRTRVARVRAEYPNQLDYSGSGMCSTHTYFRLSSYNCPSCQMHQPRIEPMLAALVPSSLSLLKLDEEDKKVQSADMKMRAERFELPTF